MHQLPPKLTMTLCITNKEKACPLCEIENRTIRDVKQSGVQKMMGTTEKEGATYVYFMK